MIESSDHSSIRLFSIGVPVSASLNGAASSRTQLYVFAWWFLTNCASSRITPAHCDRAVGLGVEPEQRVGRDDDVGGRELLDRPRRTSRSVSVTALTREPGCEARRLADPVRDDARRRDDQERAEAGIALASVADERERLQRLAEPHVVGEDAAEPELPERGEPVEPVALVGPELGARASRQLVLGERVEVEQRVDLPLPALGLLGRRRRARRARPRASPGSG